jgi:hypothetical protein
MIKMENTICILPAKIVAAPQFTTGEAPEYGGHQIKKLFFRFLS